MKHPQKSLTCILLLSLLFSSIAFVESAYAQTSTPQPAVPEFTLKLINSTYNVVDPYTGVSQQKYNSSIEISIKNQQFTYSDYHLYYNVRTKPRFGEEWTEIYPILTRATAPYNNDTKSFPTAKFLTDEFRPALEASNSDYTVVSYALNGENAYYAFDGLSSNAHIDFQVEAIVGHNAQAWYVQHPLYPEYGGYYEQAIAYDTDSGWSGTKTLNLQENTTTSTQQAAPTPAATVPPSENSEKIQTQQIAQTGSPAGFDWEKVSLAAAAVAIAVLATTVIVLWRIRK
jgi:hypothetical protein